MDRANGCWAHACRNSADLYKVSKDPVAKMAVRQIAGLYWLENKIRHRPVEKLRLWRQRYARPMLERLRQCLEQQKNACRENSALYHVFLDVISKTRKALILVAVFLFSLQFVTLSD